MAVFPDPRLSRIRARALAWALLPLVLGLAIACSNSTPTSPDVSSASRDSAHSESVAARRPVRQSAPRVVPMRVGTAPVVQGLWGGQDIGITILTSGASVDYDCAAGSIDAPFVTDASGRFDLAGAWWFTPPVLPENWQADKRPARYSGVIDGDTMTLTVTRLDDGTTSGFKLIRNAVPRVLHCL